MFKNWGIWPGVEKDGQVKDEDSPIVNEEQNTDIHKAAANDDEEAQRSQMLEKAKGFSGRSKS